MKINEHEMRGLLAGKCLPGDMRLNEDLPAYLVRKFEEMQQKLDALEDKLSRAQDWALGVDTERMHFIEKCSELSAENAALKQWAKETDELWVNDCDLDSHLDSVPQTPATDAYLNSVRAEGVERFIHESAYEIPHRIKCGLMNYANQLRSGTHDTADKAGAK